MYQQGATRIWPAATDLNSLQKIDIQTYLLLLQKLTLNKPQNYSNKQATETDHTRWKEQTDKLRLQNNPSRGQTNWANKAQNLYLTF